MRTVFQGKEEKEKQEKKKEKGGAVWSKCTPTLLTKLVWRHEEEKEEEERKKKRTQAAARTAVAANFATYKHQSHRLVGAKFGTKRRGGKKKFSTMARQPTSFAAGT